MTFLQALPTALRCFQVQADRAYDLSFLGVRLYVLFCLILELW